MNGNISDYARLGLVHHMLYPECMSSPQVHIDTLREFLTLPRLETFDCCLPYGDDARREAIDIIKSSGLSDVAFAIHFFPFKKMQIASSQYGERAQARLILKDMIEQAISMNASGFVFGAGGPSALEAGPENFAAFAEFCRWLCGLLKPHGITALLEPFDTDFDKKFIYGSSASCCGLIESLRPEVDNLAIELDLAHIPLMGEDFSESIHTLGPCIKRIHLGNCVKKNPDHPRYGDTHPPVGFPEGEIDVPELVEIFRALLDTGFLSTEKRGSLLIEMTPWPGKTVRETVEDNFRRVDEAWSKL